MSRLIVVAALLSACSSCSSKPAANQDPVTPAPSSGTDRVAVPGAAGGAEKAAVGGGTDSARLELHPDEGTMTIAKADGKAGAELTTAINITPSTGFHINTEFPIELKLDAPAGVTLAKAAFSAGGIDKAQGDATALTEKQLQFTIKATAAQAGSYSINGKLKFAVCTNNNTECRAKKQPIVIAVAAN